jgi:ATP-dependent helicase/nuclease subunit A
MLETPKFQQFNHNQRHALDTARNLAVRANAGTGKTSVLVERVVQLLDRHRRAGTPLNVSAIVAITFTRKAAAEFRERLRESFLERIQATKDQGDVGYWSAQLDLLPPAMIGTIDSFCARLLREFAWMDETLDRLEPEFESLEGFAEERLKKEAVDRVVNRLSAPPTGRTSSDEQRAIEACRWWLTTQGFWSLERHLVALLNHLVDPEKILEAHDQLTPASQRVEQFWSVMPLVIYVRENRSRIRSDLERLMEDIRQLKKPSAFLREFRAQLLEVTSLLLQEDRHALQLTFGILRKKLFTEEGKPRIRDFTSIKSQIAPVQETWGALKDFEFDFDAEVAALEATDRLVCLFKSVHAEYLNLCHQTNSYDFLTLERRTRDLLARSAAIQKLLKDRWRYIMVDEFQDTNRLQWEIISWLVGDGPDGLLDADRLFVVGDPQQSIYRFRNADVSVFAHVKEAIRSANQHHGHANRPTHYDKMLKKPSTPEQRLGLLPLAENYRTLHPVPLQLLDHVFQNVFDPDLHGLDLEKNNFEIPYQRFEFADSLASPPAGEVIYVLPANPDSEEESLEESANDSNEAETAGDDLSDRQVVAVVDQLLQMYGRPRLRPDPARPPTLEWQDMAVLLPSRTVVLTKLETELHRRNIPFVVTKGIGFWQRQEVRDLVNLVSTIADAGDELALFAVLRGPLGQLTDTEILFLSQMGRGRLDRGLRSVVQYADSINRAARPMPAEPADPLAAALEEVWRNFSAGSKERLCQLYRRLHAWRARVDRMPHADLLQRAIEESHAYALYAADATGEVILGNLMRLLALIRAEEERSAPGLARLSRLLRQQVDDSLKEEQATLALGRDALQIMTVHAAKGLEFPVVAVLKMEKEAASNWRPPLMIVSESDKLLADDCKTLPQPLPGTVAVKIRHPQRPRETYTPGLLRALHRLNSAQELAESRRLFYVAATRAKERLILAGKQPKSKKNGDRAKLAVSWQKWFEDALGITETQKQAGAWEDPTKEFRVAIITGISGNKWRESAGTPSPQTINLEQIGEGPLAPSITVSTLDEMLELWASDKRAWHLKYRAQLLPQIKLPVLEKPVARSQRQDLKYGRITGILVHRLLEMRDVISLTSTNDLLPVMAGNLLSQSAVDWPANGEVAPLIPPDEVQEVVAAAQAILQKVGADESRANEIRALVEAPGETEVDFVLRLGRWHITGRFDKLLATPSGNQIVDWKTDRDEDPATIIKRYQNQMKLYALALYRIGKAAIDQGAVPVRLVLLHHLQVVSLSFAVAELEAFAACLATEFTRMETYVPGQNTAGSSQ